MFERCAGLMDEAAKKIGELTFKDLGSLSTMEKARESIALEKLLIELNAYSKWDESAKNLAEKCAYLRQEIALSEIDTSINTQKRTAKVITQGIKETPYDVPWMR